MPQRLNDEILLKISVNGQSTVLKVSENSPLNVVIPKALEQTKNTGQPPDKWELKDGGVTLDLNKKIKDFNFPEGTVLFLSLKAGAGGTNR